MRDSLESFRQANRLNRAMRNNSEIVLNITPVAKPRMTRSDAWKKRACVTKYWKFKDELRSLVTAEQLPHPLHLVFVMPMPESWSLKKKQKMLGEYHKVKPDCDNMIKAFLDCLYKNDQHVADIRGTKIWGWTGQIIVRPMGAIANDS